MFDFDRSQRLSCTPHVPAHRGFTLIELLVVIAIIALLIAILLPSLSAARTQSKKIKTLAHLRGIGQSVTLYEADYRDRRPTVVDPEEKAFLGLALLSKLYQLPEEFYINPNTTDTRAERRDAAGRPILAELVDVAIANDTQITPNDLPQVRWHCSFAYDNDVKKNLRGSARTYVYLGDRANYERGETFSGNWGSAGMCLLWTDQHAEFRKRKSLPDQRDPNLYHHNEFDGEGSDEVVDDITVTPDTLDTHLRFFTEEEDDELLPN